MNRFARPLLFSLTVLSACTVVPVIDPNPNAELRFNICEDALELPAGYRAFQGYEGWLYFQYDLEETYPLMAQTDFIAELSERLKTQGVTLVVLPVSSRALLRPDTLYLDDPQQAAFSPDGADEAYTAFLDALKDADVEVVDAVAAAKAFAARGGQAFFKRDLHWTTEGANALFQETARVVRRAVGNVLPEAELVLTRNPQDDEHRGQFVSRWLYTHCGYVLPAEPLGVYSVSRPDQGDDLFGGSAPEVVLTGSSFSLEPYSYDFLAVALQSEVLNASIGAGGALVALQSYLLDGAYDADRPRVLVWELPIFADPLPEAAQRELLASVYGACTGEATRFERAPGSASLMRLAVSGATAANSYLSLGFEDLGLLRFDVVLRYRDGTKETLAVERSSLTLNRGRYYLALADTPGAVLTGVELGLPRRTEGAVTVQLCRTPR